MPHDPMSQYNTMLKKYGTQVTNCSTKIYLTHDEMVRLFGSRCGDYEPSCIVCKNWLLWDETGQAILESGRKEFLKFYEKG